MFIIYTYCTDKDQSQPESSSPAPGIGPVSVPLSLALGPGPELEREASVKVSCLSPARVIVPGGHRVVSVACGLHHSVLLSEHGK